MVEFGKRKREAAEGVHGRDVTAGEKLTKDDIEDLLRTPSATPLGQRLTVSPMPLPPSIRPGTRFPWWPADASLG